MAIRAVTKTTPLLEMLAFRWQEFIQGMPDPTLHAPAKRPHFHPVELAKLREIAGLHAQSDNSDPFAYGRAMRKMRSGEWLPSEVRADAIGKIHARAVSGITIPAVAE